MGELSGVLFYFLPPPSSLLPSSPQPCLSPALPLALSSLTYTADDLPAGRSSRDGALATWGNRIARGLSMNAPSSPDPRRRGTIRPLLALCIRPFSTPSASVAPRAIGPLCSPARAQDPQLLWQQPGCLDARQLPHALISPLSSDIALRSAASAHAGPTCANSPSLHACLQVQRILGRKGEPR